MFFDDARSAETSKDTTMARASIAFLAGLGTGYLNAKEKEKDRERQGKIDQIAFDRADRESEQYATEKKNKSNLAAAYKPATVSENAATLDISGKPVLYEDANVAQSDYRQARMLADTDTADAAPSIVNAPKQTFAAAGIPYADKASAQAGAAAYNKPEAQMQRVIAAVGGVDPLKGIQLQRNQTQYEREQAAFIKLATQEGYAQTARAMLGGDAQQVFATYNKQGTSKLKEPPTVTRADLELPGFGTVPNFTYAGTMVDGNGVERPFTMNSHEANMGLMPYKDRLDLQRKGSDSENKALFQGGIIDARNAAVDAKLEAIKAREAGGGGTSKEERLRLTSLFSESGRRMGEAQKALSSLRKDIMYSMAKPGSSQYQEMQDMQASIKQLGEERGMYQSLLAGSQSGGGAASSAAASGTPTGPTNPAERQMKEALGSDMGADPNAIARELEATKAGIASATNPADKKLLQDYLANVERQGRAIGVQPALASAQPPAQPVKNMASTFGKDVPLPAMPKAKTELKVGTVYSTARGPAKWNGTAFEAQ